MIKKDFIKYFPLIVSVKISAIIIIVNYFAFKSSLYWKIYWLDMAVHFLGGLALGFLFLYIITGLKEKGVFLLPKLITFLAILSFATLGGVLWEIFEYLLREFFYPVFTMKRNLIFGEVRYQDTISDLGFDLLGGFLAALLSTFYIRYNDYDAKDKNS